MVPYLSATQARPKNKTRPVRLSRLLEYPLTPPPDPSIHWRRYLSLPPQTYYTHKYPPHHPTTLSPSPSLTLPQLTSGHHNPNPLLPPPPPKTRDDASRDHLRLPPPPPRAIASTTPPHPTPLLRRPLLPRPPRFTRRTCTESVPPPSPFDNPCCHAAEGERRLGWAGLGWEGR